KNDKFRNAAGVYMKLINLASLHEDKAEQEGLNTSKTDRAVWEAYSTKPDLVRQLAGQIAKGIEIIETEDDSDDMTDDAFEAVEGAVLTRVHKLRERKRGFRSRLISRVERS